MKKKENKEEEFKMPPLQYWIVANVDMATIKQGPYPTKQGAKDAAEEAMHWGIWMNDQRLYPPYAIVYIEVVQGMPTDGN